MRIKRGRFDGYDISRRPTYQDFDEGEVRISVWENETWRAKRLKFDVCRHVILPDGTERFYQGIPLEHCVDAFLCMQEFAQFAASLRPHLPEWKPNHVAASNRNVWDPYDVNRVRPFKTFEVGEVRIRIWRNEGYREFHKFDCIHVFQRGSNEEFCVGIPVVHAQDALFCMHNFAVWAYPRRWMNR